MFTGSQKDTRDTSAVCLCWPNPFHILMLLCILLSLLISLQPLTPPSYQQLCVATPAPMRSLFHCLLCLCSSCLTSSVFPKWGKPLVISSTFTILPFLAPRTFLLGLCMKSQHVPSDHPSPFLSTLFAAAALFLPLPLVRSGLLVLFHPCPACSESPTTVAATSQISLSGSPFNP